MKRESDGDGCQLSNADTLPLGSNLMLEYVISVGAPGLSSSEQ